jgi:hypothetical protein
MNLELDGKSTEEFSVRQSAHWQREEEQIQLAMQGRAKQWSPPSYEREQGTYPLGWDNRGRHVR